MATANLFFGLLTLATNAATIALLVLIVAGRTAPAALRSLGRVRRLAVPLAAVLATVSMLGSLYYSEVLGLRPCTLCWYQRGAMYPLAVLLIAAAVTRRPILERSALPLAVVGLGISGYHYLIQHVPALSAQAVCSADVPCTAAEIWQFNFMSMAYMAGSAFLLITLLLVVHRTRRDERKPDAAAGRRDAGVLATAAVALAGVFAVLFAPAPPSSPLPAGAAVAAPQVEGEALPALESPADDPAVGQPLPELTGSDYDGNAVGIEQDGRPKVVIAAAHWCSHCQVEVPAVQEWLDDNGAPEGVDLYSISTAADAGQANYPPGEWLAREGWTVPVIADDEAGTARTAIGVSGYPFFVFVDARGIVVGRHAGELGTDQLARVITTLQEQGPSG